MNESTPVGNIRSLSLRDPSGNVFEFNSQLFRQVHSSAKSEWEVIKQSKALKSFIEKGLFVRTWELNDSDIHALKSDFARGIEHTPGDLYLRHEKIPFVSYPYEWAPEMLQAAGVLTLDLAQELSQENLGLKDATPFNVLFSGCNPIFVDLLSVEQRDPKDSLWIAFSQFSKTFLNPLIAYQHLGIPLVKTFLLEREGLSASDIYTHSSWFKKITPAFFFQITLPALLENWSDKKLGNHPSTKRLTDPEKAKFTLEFFLKSARKKLSRLNFDHASQRTQFKNYMGHESPYTRERFQAKEALVKSWLAEFSKQSVLDLGCNDGHFSKIAANLGRQVVAIDSEAELISKTWKTCRVTHPTILPLVINIANPSPAAGWRNQEHRSFLERAKGHFDCVLMLAVIHHLLTTESILLPHIIELANDLTTDYLILEWVETWDPMFEHLSKGRDYSHLTSNYFEQQCSRHFKVVKKETLPGNNRILYLLKKKQP